MVPTGPTEIVFAANRFNRTSVSFPLERNSGMDCDALSGPTASVAVADQRASARRPGARPRCDSRYPFVNFLQQGMKQTCDFHLDSPSIDQGDMHSIDGRNGSRLFTTSAGDQPRKIADAREPPGPPLGGSHLKPAI